MHIAHISRRRFFHTLGWSLLMCALIVGVAATLGRATFKLHAALQGQEPDVAVVLLLKEKDQDEEITHSELLQGDGDRRMYLVYGKKGPMLVELRKGDGKDHGTEEEEEIPWHITSIESLHESSDPEQKEENVSAVP